MLFIPSTSMHVVVVLPAIMGYSCWWPYLLFLSYKYTYIYPSAYVWPSFCYLVTNLLILQSSLLFVV